eukprot:jgi/Ulvmu1/4602/UM002_0331.1
MSPRASGDVGGAPEGASFTIEDALKHIGFGNTQILMFIFVGIAWAGDGMEAMLLSYLGPELRCKWNLSPSQESWITSAVFIGMMLGSYTWGWISDRYGRKVGYFAPAVFTAAFGVLSAVSPNYGALLFFRACVGFGIAGAHVAYTLFMEYVAPAHRGQCMALIEGFWTLGAIHLAGMAWLILPDLGWRALVLVAAAPLLALVAVYPLLKESPHWLLVNDRPEDAMVVLQWAARFNGKQLPAGTLIHHSAKLHAHVGAQGAQDAAVFMQPAEGGSVDPSVEPAPGNGSAKTAKSGVAEHVRQIVTGFRDSVRQMIFNRDLATTSVLLAFVWIGVALAYYGIILLGVEVFAAKNNECTDDDSAHISGTDFKDVFITSLGEIGGLIVCMLFIDYWGRRRCLYVFVLFTAVFTAPLLRPNAAAADEPTAPVDVICIFGTRMFAYGSFIALFIYTPEIYPTKIRSFAFGIYNALSRLGGLVSPFVAVDLAQQSGIRAAAGVLLGGSAVAGILAVFLPIETMGRSLPEDTEEIQELAILERENTGGKLGKGNEASRGQGGPAVEQAHKPGATEPGNPFHVTQLEAPIEGTSLEQQPVPAGPSQEENPFHVSQLDTPADAPADGQQS